MISQFERRDVTQLLGFRKQPNSKGDEGQLYETNSDVAMLFFDKFSGRLNSFETNLRLLSVEVETLKVSGDQSKLSDLVLLERLQKTEKILGDSLNWIKQIADAVLRPTGPTMIEPELAEAAPSPSTPTMSSDPQTTSRVLTRHDPSILQPGSLTLITTPTELHVLTLLANEGPKSAPEIGKFVGRSREHTARLMKKLFDEGYVRRDQARIPFRYSTVERVKNSFKKSVQADPGKEVASAPQA